MFQVVDTDATFLETRIAEQVTVQRRIGFDAGNRQLIEGNAHFGHGLVAVFTDDTDFADQAVVVRRDAVALINMAVDADAEAAGQVAAFNQPGLGMKLYGSSALIRHSKRMAFNLDVFLFVLQRQAGCDA